MSLTPVEETNEGFLRPPFDGDESENDDIEIFIPKQIRRPPFDGDESENDDIEIFIPKQIRMPEQAKTVGDKKVESFVFKTEIVKLMSLINNINFKKEIFLTELIKNSTNALKEISYESLTDPSKLGLGKNLEIRIVTNKNTNTMSIFDTGIGMTRDDLVNLGSNSKFSSSDFIEVLLSGYDISKFSLGFFSAYLIADKVVVHTKHNNDKDYIWESTADGAFTVKSATGQSLGRGTRITLYIKKDQNEYLEKKRIEEVLNKHCQFCCYPIKLLEEGDEYEEQKMCVSFTQDSSVTRDSKKFKSPNKK